MTASDRKVWKWTVPESSSGPSPERADRFLLEAIQGGLGSFAIEPIPSRSQIQKWIENGQISANGELILARSKMEPGDEIEIRIVPAVAIDLTPLDHPLEILFQDEHIAVINKPAGITVHPSETSREGTLVHILLHHLKDLSGIGGELRPGIVHRLDKDTSGVLVVSKTNQAHQILSEMFASHDLERRYWALCFGVPKWPKGAMTVESKIGRNPTDRKKMASHVEDGRDSITHFTLLKHFEKTASLIEARLETGRTHQVRVHLTSLGHSLFGDPLYGTPTDRQSKWKALSKEVQKAVSELPGQALHARVLGFQHPITKEQLRFEVGPPPAFQKILDLLESENP